MARAHARMVDERPRLGTAALGSSTIAVPDAAANNSSAPALSAAGAASASGMSPCDVEALKRCLIEHDGDQKRCQAEVEAFKRACGMAQQGGGGAAR